MEPKYWIPSKKEADEFRTYGYNLHPLANEELISFYKKQFPAYCNVPSENPNTIKLAKDYFDISNKEDLLVLHKEKEYFDKFYNKELKDILPYIK